MSSLPWFLMCIAGGCLLTLLTLLFARDIIRVTQYNRTALSDGKRPIVFELIVNYVFGGLALGAAIAFSIHASITAFAFVCGCFS